MVYDWHIYISPRVGFCVAPFLTDGQCEGLDSWDGQQVQAPTLFFWPYAKSYSYFQPGLSKGCRKAATHISYETELL